MKKRNWIISALMLTVFVSGCGQSSEEKEKIAIVSCNVMAETRNMDAAIRIREINAAREKIGEELFLLNDYAIKQSFSYGLCKELVLNDPNYDELMSNAMRPQIEARKKLKEKREAAQKKREKDKEILARVLNKQKETQKKWEAKVLKKELDAQKEAQKEPQKEWRNALSAELQKRDYKPKIKSITYNKESGKLKLLYSCVKIEGFKYKLKVVLKNNLGTFGSSRMSCHGEGDKRGTLSIYTNKMTRKALSEASDANSLIERMHIEVYGIDRFGASKFESHKLHKQLSPESFPPLGYNAVLDNPIIYEGEIGN